MKRKTMHLVSFVLIVTILVSIFTGIPATASTAITNLFNTATMSVGYVNGSGNANGDNNYRVSAPIAVSQGDLITFGAAVINQGFHLVTMSSETAYNGQYTLGSGITSVTTIDSATAIMCFTVPKNVTFIRLIADTKRASRYLVTKNRSFTVDEYETFFDTDYINLFDPTTATPGWVNSQGNTSSDNQYRVTPPIAVAEGDLITLAGAVTKQGFHLVTMSDSNTYVEQYTLSNGITKAEDLDTKTSIMSFTVPAGIKYIRVIAATAYKDVYLVTKNHPITKAGYNSYFFADKTALFVGDSISYGAGDGGRAWAARIANSLGLTPDNQSVNGWAISASRNTRIINEIRGVKENSYDYVIMEGGTNDAWDKARIGTIADTYDPKDFDISTFAGALEELFYTAYQQFPGARFGFIITFKMPLATDKGNVAQMEPYANMSIEICKKWNIPYLDLYHDDYVNNTLLEVNTTTYIPDTVHPNAAGYDRLSPYIEEWFKTLSVNDISSFESKMPDLTDRTAKIPYAVGNTLYVNDCDAIYGWVPSANSSLLLDTENKQQGEGSLSLYGYSPAENSTGAGSMAFLYLPQAADLSGYDTILYDFYLSKDMTDKTGFLQLNFATQTQDGYNTSVGLSDKTAGWHSVSLSATNSAWEVHSSLDWKAINLLRFTWFYRDSGVEDLTILIDNIRFYKTVEDEIIDPVLAKIDAIGTVTKDNYKEKTASIQEAEKAVADLVTTYGPDVMTQITSADTLTAAREAHDGFAENDMPDDPIIVLYPYGNINEDNAINAGDALMALKAAVEKLTLTERQFTIANVNGDDTIDAKDALLILRKAVNKIEKFPVEEA